MHCTNENGRILLNGLAPGLTVAAKELRAAAEYALDGTVKTATMQKGEGTKLTFYNSPLAREYP